MSEPSDRVLRVITADNTFRIMVASTAAMVRGVVAAQHAHGLTARCLSDLLTGIVLVRETMSPGHRVQGLLSGAGGRGRLVADTHPDGSTRGLVQLPAGTTELVLGDGSTLQVLRTMASGALYRGLVRAPAEGDVASVLMSYFQESEQIVSVVGVATCVSDEQIDLAGGYVVQLLPEADRAALRTMTERLEGLQDTVALLHRSAGSPEAMLAELVGGLDHVQLDDRPVQFRCWCNLDAVVGAIATLSRAEVAELLANDSEIEVSCDYCRAAYRVSRSRLQGLLQPS
jgi:molecular chaperone Hsp33